MTLHVETAHELVFCHPTTRAKRSEKNLVSQRQRYGVDSFGGGSTGHFTTTPFRLGCALVLSTRNQSSIACKHGHQTKILTMRTMVNPTSATIVFITVHVFSVFATDIPK